MKFVKLVKARNIAQEYYDIAKKVIELRSTLDSVTQKLSNAIDKRHNLDEDLYSNLEKDVDVLKSVIDNTLSTLNYYDGQLLNYLN